ncbi:interferon alpha-inducible protein 27-like protein 2A isoform X2 [Hippoglossus hippoglossus]|nr:interferon alpha-inducible protein 27-like protein 2A isoform X2 [Hippoglossus hippoglossus]XP_034431333.1 interferon alpha-inducible protein 27-like protein 2A isoform X2 [Hippoglossus hippoglossus]XP_035023300.1 interferon alpha-inducible protein 27-like protein 2A isoform X3 [Hippoglossus stenolepis]
MGVKGTTAAIIAGAAGAVILVPVSLGAIGFTATGIAAGSMAATMMSSAAVAGGGGVAAGSLVAVLQSAGTAGLSWAVTGVVASTGAAVGWLTSLISRKSSKEKKD